PFTAFTLVLLSFSNTPLCFTLLNLLSHRDSRSRNPSDISPTQPSNPTVYTPTMSGERMKAYHSSPTSNAADVTFQSCRDGNNSTIIVVNDSNTHFSGTFTSSLMGNGTASNHISVAPRGQQVFTVQNTAPNQHSTFQHSNGRQPILGGHMNLTRDRVTYNHPS
ncbi:MAG: hypothetical protein J3R72DRAFT_504762, partial [Linnemannia gamsii]